MTVHTKWEILVQQLLKSVELFKGYGLFGKMLKKITFLDQNILCSLPNRLSCFLLLYCILIMLQKQVLYTPVGVI